MGQGVQDEAKAGEDFPAGQLAQVPQLPEAQIVPGPQGWQAEVPAVLNVPGLQALQLAADVAPAAPVPYVPAEQGVQVELPGLLWKKPTGQGCLVSSPGQ